ncbi:MAG: RloB family protein [Proteobacteria bacterium]|nr:RloB family protein [Pseudomonadota bacterium]
MGSDNLFHKRKQRGIASLKRKKASRAPYDRVLIVCEGSKTEPNYFKEIRDAYRLHSTNIEICGEECGSDPLSVIKYAISRFKQDPDYDRVYCVIDRDRHANFDDAIDKLLQNSRRKGIIFSPIISVPCFEFWLLLHFYYTTHQFSSPVGSSDCALVISELTKNGLIPSYSKEARDIFSLTKHLLPQAIKNAKQLQRYNQTTGTNNPATNMHELIQYLIALVPP